MELRFPLSPAENMSLSTLLLLLLLNTDLMKKREGERDIFKEKHAGFKAHGRESSVQKADWHIHQTSAHVHNDTLTRKHFFQTFKLNIKHIINRHTNIHEHVHSLTVILKMFPLLHFHPFCCGPSTAVGLNFFCFKGLPLTNTTLMYDFCCRMSAQAMFFFSGEKSHGNRWRLYGRG